MSPQHVLGHHPYTNIDGADPDIVTAAAVSHTHYHMPTHCLCFSGNAGHTTHQVGPDVATKIFLPTCLCTNALLFCELVFCKIN